MNVDPKPRMTDEKIKSEWGKAGGRVDQVEGLSLMLTGEYLTFRRDLDAKTVALAECVSRLKLRIAFIGWPGESYFNVGSDKYDWWVPDWRYELALIEHALHGTPVDQPEKPTDTTKSIDLKRAAHRGYRNLPTPLGAGDTYPEGPHTKDYVAGHNKVLAQVTETLRASTAGAPKPAGAVPEGYALVPAKMYVSPEQWDAAQFAFGGPGTDEGEGFYDCTLWVGEIENDDGSKTHGLHVSCDECPEEGSITLSSLPAACDPSPTAEHVLYEKDDADAPDSIKDRNGDITLALCRNCGRAESDLAQPCFGIPCEDCPPADYPTDKTRCAECPRRGQENNDG